MAFGKKEKTFATITAPLSGMVEELDTYVGEQEEKVVNLNEEKAMIDRQIGNTKPLSVTLINPNYINRKGRRSSGGIW